MKHTVVAILTSVPPPRVEEGGAEQSGSQMWQAPCMVVGRGAFCELRGLARRERIFAWGGLLPAVLPHQALHVHQGGPEDSVPDTSSLGSQTGV